MYGYLWFRNEIFTDFIHKGSKNVLIYLVTKLKVAVKYGNMGGANHFSTYIAYVALEKWTYSQSYVSQVP